MLPLQSGHKQAVDFLQRSCYLVVVETVPQTAKRFPELGHILLEGLLVDNDIRH
jgi:hypothetical protein